MTIHILLAGFMAANLSPLEMARDHQDRAALTRMVNEAASAAAKAPNSADAQYRMALASSYLAEVDQELHDKKGAQQAAIRGIAAADQAIKLKGNDAEYYRVLGTLCGQAVTDLLSGLSYGPRAKEAINKAVSLAPKSSDVYVARGVGNYYLPGQLGGGVEEAIADFRKAIQLNGNNAEAWLWLGLSLRRENKNAEARQALEKSLAIDPNRVWAKDQLAKTPK
jgi:tetratricopeptide (TPR) repeat protein